MEWSQYCVVRPVGWNRYQLTVVWSGIAILQYSAYAVRAES